MCFQSHLPETKTLHFFPIRALHCAASPEPTLPRVPQDPLWHQPPLGDGVYGIGWSSWLIRADTALTNDSNGGCMQLE